jgi:N-methylhydantoinase B
VSVTRPGSILEPGPERPVVGGNHETCQRIADAIFRALEPVVPERLSAGGSTTSGLLLFGAARAGAAMAGRGRLRKRRRQNETR